MNENEGDYPTLHGIFSAMKEDEGRTTGFLGYIDYACPALFIETSVHNIMVKLYSHQLGQN
jgi:hypothetical protein